jgi:hypothetical protein
MSSQKWVRRTLRQLSTAMQTAGFSVSPGTVRRLLKARDFSLKSARKEQAPGHPERDRQFRYIGWVKKCFQRAGQPFISVDAKKKERLGAFKNAGRQWCREAERVNLHDFPQEAVGQATPYGIYDPTHNLGYVAVSSSADTPEFAVAAIRWWWELSDRPHFPDESRLLILADAGGSNGCRFWRWKQQIQEQLADQLGIEVMVCHYPTGTSKWNPVEHRLFSYISLNWAGQTLHSVETLLNYIRGTTTTTGLKVQACLMQQEFKKGLTVTKSERAALNLHRRRVCPQWNYILKPRKGAP